jgi:hypothetical protein
MDDLGETNNLIQAQPDRTRKLREELQVTRQRGNAASGASN